MGLYRHLCLQSHARKRGARELVSHTRIGVID